MDHSHATPRTRCLPLYAFAIQVGERVLFEGMPGEPASSAQIKKKKVFEGVMPDLKTNGERVACYKGVVMATTAGPCVVKSVVNGHIK